MNPTISNESTIQNNTIDFLKQMGYIFITQEENARLRNGKLGEVLLRDILLEQLQEINSFDYKGVEYKFSPKNIAKAIDELNVPLNEGLMSANQKISDKLMLGTSYDEELIDGVKKAFHSITLILTIRQTIGFTLPKSIPSIATSLPR